MKWYNPISSCPLFNVGMAAPQVVNITIANYFSVMTLFASTNSDVV